MLESVLIGFMDRMRVDRMCIDRMYVVRVSVVRMYFECVC